ncbi:MAG: L,D-transpeptidase family protein [Halarcobacter sp.]
MYKKIIFEIFIFSLFLEADSIKLIKNTPDILKSDIKKTIKKSKPFFFSKTLMNKYYKNFDYKLFWFDENIPKSITSKLIETIKKDEVLKPILDKKIFDLKDIEIKLSELNENSPVSEIIDLDIKLTNIYHQYISYLSNGVIDWGSFENELLYLKEQEDLDLNWQKYKKYINFRKLLYKVVENNSLSIIEEKIENPFYNTSLLKQKIEEYKTILSTGGFVKVSKSNISLKKGNSYEEIKDIRRRLIQSKDLDDFACSFDESYCDMNFDKELFEAVKSFQKRYGLEIDGIIGNNTIKALNIPVEKKIEKIRVNLERIRLLPSNFGEKFIYVNIPDYRLKLFNKNNLEFETAVIVGKKENPTPIFSHRMSEIIVNPYWRIPQNIVKKELISKLIENPNYLKEKNIKVFENWDINSIEYDVSFVDWSMYLDNNIIGNDKEAPMRFIQFPDNKNPLGKMKFMFPNKYSVYLHDTPYKRYFNRTKRAYSHGCIRVNNPKQLLLDILKDEKIYDGMDYTQLLNLKVEVDLDLEQKVPVHIVYLTTWIDENKKINFRDDIYDLDKIQADVLYNPNYEKKELETKTLSALN